jgi:hypothetical protein
LPLKGAIPSSPPQIFSRNIDAPVPLHGQSLAIQAAKTALETGGFALPEPIYRLRFDGSPAFALRETAAPSPHSQPVAKQPAKHADHDVAPDTQIAKLVQEERSGAQKDDLLDSQRPIE